MAMIVLSASFKLARERRHQARDVLREHVDPVGVEAARLVALSVAAQIGSHHVKARLGERRNLVAPRGPVLGKAMQEEHERPAPRLRAMESDAVPEIDPPVRWFHGRAILPG